MNTVHHDPHMMALAKVMVEVFPVWPDANGKGIVFFVNLEQCGGTLHDGLTPIFARAITHASISMAETVNHCRSLTPEQHVRVALSWVSDAGNPGMTENITHDMWLAAKEVAHEQDA